MGQPLGKGATSYVYQVKSRKNDQVYAMKVLDKEKLNELKKTSQALNEITIHSELKCQYIAELYHFFEDEAHIYMIMELCDGNELFQEIKTQQLKSKGGFSEPQAQAMFKQLALGVKYMQDRNILHRDLKPGNIIFTHDKQLKIIDLGLAIKLQDFQEEQATLCGTPNYLSPETLNGKRFGPQSDLWSLGCILFSILTGAPPFESQSIDQTLKKIKTGTYTMPTYLSYEAKDLIKRLLTFDPKQRITIDEVLEHQFLETATLIRSQCQPQNLLDQIRTVQNAQSKFETLDAERDNKENQQVNCQVQETPAFNENQLPRKAKKKQSYMKQLDFVDNQKQKSRAQQYRKIDQLKEKINQKITNIRSSVQTLTASSHQESSVNYDSQYEEFKSDQEYCKEAVKENDEIMKPNNNLNQKDNIQQAKVAQLEEQKKSNNKTNLCTDLKPLNTLRLNPIKLKTEKNNGYIKIKENGWISLLLQKQMKKIQISPDGQSIILQSLSIKNYQIEYKFERLPSKLKPYYHYASEFVRVTRSKTPKIIYANNILKCYFMENDPLNNIEVEFLEAAQSRPPQAKQVKKQVNTKHVKVLYQRGSELMEVNVRDVAMGTTNRYEFNPHSDFDSLDEQMQYYVDESLKAIEECEEENYRNSQKADEEIIYPIIIDQRTSIK